MQIVKLRKLCIVNFNTLKKILHLNLEETLSQPYLAMGISEYRIQKDPNPKLSGIQIEI